MQNLRKYFRAEEFLVGRKCLLKIIGIKTTSGDISRSHDVLYVHALKVVWLPICAALASRVIWPKFAIFQISVYNLLRF